MDLAQGKMPAVSAQRSRAITTKPLRSDENHMKAPPAPNWGQTH